MRQDETRFELWILALLFAALVLVVVDPTSFDLRAMWMAGRFFGENDVYAGSDGVFTMMPPEIWVQTLRAEDSPGPVYPFIYPPLWAWLMSKLVAWTSFTTLAQVVSLANAFLVAASVWLACRITRPAMPAKYFLMIGAVLCLTLLGTLLALEENQPQIFVTFLILLGIERQRSGSPTAGGIAMALAASIKLYPVVFALIWWAAGERRATASFAICGAALAALSIAVAGWPLHIAFLNEISAISRTVIVSMANFSLDSVLGEMRLGADELQRIDSAATGGKTSWGIAEKTPLWRILSAVLQVVTLAALLWVARRSKMADPLLWPAAFFLTSWVSPLSWIFHYMTVFHFLPALADRLGMRLGLVFIVVVAYPISFLALITGLGNLIGAAMIIPVTNAALVFGGLTFLVLGLRGQSSAKA